jgi:hypothetical protein
MLKSVAVAAVLISVAGASANAASYIVDAKNNSSSGGVGVSTISLTAGQNFTVSVDPDDLWNAGALPRWSDANGLTGPLFATGTDESGETAGTQIGSDFGLWNQNGLSAAYGSLVGEIGGVFMKLGTNFSGPAWASGALNLYYWDSNNGDNTQFITADVVAVPEPATWAMMLAGFGALGIAVRRRTRTTYSFG